MAYSEEFKANALVKLATNGGDLESTAAELGVAKSTLHRWSTQPAKRSMKRDKKEQSNETKQNETKPDPEFRVQDGIRAAIQHLIENIPPMKGDEWGIALGILLDKMLIYEGHPTDRVENLFGQLGNLPPEAYEDIIAEAERIIADGGGADTGV